MNVTEVKIRKIENKGNLKAFADITIDNCFVLHDIKLLLGKDEKFFISMPNKQMPDGSYKDIFHPINSDTREQILNAIIKEYQV